MIEELDSETGEVRALHSLLDQPSSGSEIIPKLTSGACPEDESPPTSRIYGLVLLPTRELAIQVCRHLRILAEFIKPQVRIEAVVGGMSIQKQVRLLRRHPDIIVATPGRLWEFIQKEDPFVCTLRSMNILVVDEADRLVEKNHFEELHKLCQWLQSENSTDLDTNTTKKRKSRQTLVFSATLTFVHRGALKPGTGARKRKHQAVVRNEMTRDLKLGALRDLLGLSKRAKVFDLSTPDGLLVDQNSSSSVQDGGLAAPEGLSEVRLLCPDQPSKDARLFWFLAFGRFVPTDHQSTAETHRCLIFLNSKSGARRLAGVMRQLTLCEAFSVNGYPPPRYVNTLHAGMVQKQRLRALERFQADPNGVLISSDVASRGLDLAVMDGSESSDGVTWVVQFQVPPTAELYIHRRGRTARAHRTGTSLLFLCPDEVSQWRRIAASLKRVDSDLPDLAYQPSDVQLSACVQILDLAKRLDLTEHTANRRRATDSWFVQAAKKADIILDSDFEADDDLDEPPRKKQRNDQNKHRKKNRDSEQLRFQLKQLVAGCRKLFADKSRYQPSDVKSFTVGLRKKLKLLSRQSAEKKSP
ncbi:unnamed protein product [Calicophoron daubneyi]|uniref:ATP-dependent RNA helicase n=1 Tax=Calicophoron daubneyi TaxID=300641 RepID=A0AAV2TBH9_CALDB